MSGLGLPVELAVQMLVALTSSVISTLLKEARLKPSGIPIDLGPFCWFMLAILTLPHWTAGISVKSLQVDQTTAAKSYELNCRFPDDTDGVCSKD